MFLQTVKSDKTQPDFLHKPTDLIKTDIFPEGFSRIFVSLYSEDLSSIKINSVKISLPDEFSRICL